MSIWNILSREMFANLSIVFCLNDKQALVNINRFDKPLVASSMTGFNKACQRSFRGKRRTTTNSFGL